MEDKNTNIPKNISKKESHEKAIENARKVIEIMNKKQETTKEDGDERWW